MSLTIMKVKNSHSQYKLEQAGSSGGASAAKEPGHFQVITSSSKVTRMHLFSSKKLTTFFLLVGHLPQNTKAANTAEIVSLSK